MPNYIFEHDNLKQCHFPNDEKQNTICILIFKVETYFRWVKVNSEL